LGFFSSSSRFHFSMPFFMVRFALLIYLWLGRLAIAHRSCVSISLESFLSLLFSLGGFVFMHSCCLSVRPRLIWNLWSLSSISLGNFLSSFWSGLMISFPFLAALVIYLTTTHSYVPRLITVGYGGVTKIWAHEPRSSSINCVLRVLLYSTRNKIL